VTGGYAARRSRPAHAPGRCAGSLRRGHGARLARCLDQSLAQFAHLQFSDSLPLPGAVVLGDGGQLLTATPYRMQRLEEARLMLILGGLTCRTRPARLLPPSAEVWGCCAVR
jgi:hypothetical protein